MGSTPRRSFAALGLCAGLPSAKAGPYIGEVKRIVAEINTQVVQLDGLGAAEDKSTAANWDQ